MAFNGRPFDAVVSYWRALARGQCRRRRRVPAFRAINPDRTVPVLVLDDGTIIPDAIAICRYIEELHPDPLLMG
jgi:glutathione S-transferase